jgi:transposase
VARAREAWRTDPDGVGGVSPERLVFWDECGALTNMARLHGRSPRGTRACASAPFGHWTRLTVLGALGHGGVIAAMSVEAATGAAVFRAYLEEVLLPALRRTKPDAVLVMDNLPAHKAPCVRALLDASGFGYRYLPAYSPDLNPIEPAWAKVKAELRRVAARTADALHEALGPALAAVTARDAAGFFRHCGYSRPLRL